MEGAIEEQEFKLSERVKIGDRYGVVIAAGLTAAEPRHVLYDVLIEVADSEETALETRRSYELERA